MAKQSFDKDDILRNVSTKLLIDGKWVDAVSGKTFASINPQDETEICQVAEGDKSDVDLAVKAARKAFDEGPWPKKTGAERARILHRLADLIEGNTEELAQLETLDNGKPYAVAKAADIPLCVKHFRYFAGWADKICGKTIPNDGPFFGYTLIEPIGVVGAIIPWNFPALMMTWKIAPALAAGNAVIVKVAEQTPLTAARIGQLALDAGVPPGVLQIIQGYGPTAGAALSEHPDIDKVAFTGSTEVGRIIAVAAAKHIKPVTLELGGKSAAIVWKDVDIDRVVEESHSALFFNMGQCCAAGSRLFVHEDIYDEFVQKAVARAQKRKVGSPWEPDSEQGPQVDSDQFKKIMSYISRGKEQGATLKAGGNRVGDKGFYVEPTVFTDVRDDMDIAQEEIFGPVMVIMKYKTLSEVLARANGNEYGLAAGVWAKDVDVVNTLSRGLKAGTVWVNTYNQYDAAMPFGVHASIVFAEPLCVRVLGWSTVFEIPAGYKMSGVGRDKGEYALENYTEVKAVYQALGETAWM